MPHDSQGWRARRARRAFWLLLVLAVIAAGALTASLGAPPQRITGIGVAVSGLVLTVSITLAARILIAAERSRRRS